jgi:hypothetical protein
VPLRGSARIARLVRRGRQLEAWMSSVEASVGDVVPVQGIKARLPGR